jgi:hypothetical protein
MSFDLSRLTDIKTKTKDELYGWTEREHPGTPQHTAAVRELRRREKRDNKIRVILGACILVVLLVMAWATR